MGNTNKVMAQYMRVKKSLKDRTNKDTINTYTSTQVDSKQEMTLNSSITASLQEIGAVIRSNRKHWRFKRSYSRKLSRYSSTLQHVRTITGRLTKTKRRLSPIPIDGSRATLR